MYILCDDGFICHESNRINRIGPQSVYQPTIDHITETHTLSNCTGHHALKDKSMGFCIFNHAAGAANYALSKLGLQRVGIIDFDVVSDHGEGEDRKKSIIHVFND
jgi:hypothetical protein